MCVCVCVCPSRECYSQGSMLLELVDQSRKHQQGATSLCPFLGTHYKAAPFKKGITTRDPDLENYPHEPSPLPLIQFFALTYVPVPYRSPHPGRWHWSGSPVTMEYLGTENPKPCTPPSPKA